eukprot:207292-Amphidinium_carterae.1
MTKVIFEFWDKSGVWQKRVLCSPELCESKQCAKPIEMIDYNWEQVVTTISYDGRVAFKQKRLGN